MSSGVGIGLSDCAVAPPPYSPESRSRQDIVTGSSSIVVSLIPPSYHPSSHFSSPSTLLASTDEESPMTREVASSIAPTGQITGTASYSATQYSLRPHSPRSALPPAYNMPATQRPTFVHSPSTGVVPASTSPTSPTRPTASPSTSKYSSIIIPSHRHSGSLSSGPLSHSGISPSAQTGAGMSWQPYRDAPHPAGPSSLPISSKLENESSPIPTSATWAPLDAAPRAPGAGLYGYRRLPTGLSEVLSSRTSSWKSKLMGKEGGLGRALILGWVVTTLGFLVATAFWRGELFHALDQLSKHLFALGLKGKIIFGTLILITTIPPLPLYSTLMILAGYTFGIWQGFLVSYGASLLGAVLVFVISRTLLRDCITKALSSSPTAQSLLNIIPQNPHLLLLIRIAPYPYNLLNVILASSPALTLKTYTACTALSLIKLFLHTWIGAGIHDISAGFAHPPHHPHHRLHGQPHHAPPIHGPGEGEGPWMEDGLHRHRVRMISTWAGIILCVGLFVYMTRLAKKALSKAQAELEERERQGEQGMQFVEGARATQEA